ncbi:LysE family translocator [Nocardia panacis]|uniref:LysE family translocator n=1 Tax=Nocardia panacis TaxID=2340916 RepID=A0A3A4KC03_9NOCA|nr:LysE family translocator [Nocardia panacis]RJO69832.1 LysE family translocator [Nocardia panacis]
MAAGSVAAFWLVSFLLVLVPGADWAYVIGAGARERSVLPSVGGLIVGYVGLTLVVAGGVAAVVARNPAALTVLTTAGAAYLLWLGGTALLRPGGPPEVMLGEPTPWGARIRQGAGISGFNPKALLLFLALLPQFTDRNGQWPMAIQIGTLGMVHTVTCGVVYLGVGLAAQALLRNRPGAAKVLSRVSGIAMIVIAVALLVERFA